MSSLVTVPIVMATFTTIGLVRREYLKFLARPVDLSKFHKPGSTVTVLNTIDGNTEFLLIEVDGIKRLVYTKHRLERAGSVFEPIKPGIYTYQASKTLDLATRSTSFKHHLEWRGELPSPNRVAENLRIAS